MIPAQRALVAAVLVGSCVTLAGLCYRGRFRECWSYLGYLIALTTFGTLLAFWPARFHIWTWWIAKQAIYDALKIGVAIELALRSVAAFPGAQARLKVAMAGVLGATAGIMAWGPAQRMCLYDWQPPVVHATIWIFGVTAITVVYYRLPVSDWHRALVLAFTAKLLVFAMIMRAVGQLGWGSAWWLGLVDGAADVIVSWSLAFMVWRPATEASVLSPEVRRRFRLSWA